jgi:hypothetical protein
MTCILRISGQSLDVDIFLAKCSIQVDRTWRLGEQRILKGKFYSDSGATFVASKAEFDEFETQVVDATAFLEKHASAIATLIAFPGVQDAVLDFGVATRVGQAIQSSYLPPKFIQLAAQLGIGVEISHYLCSD